MQISGVDNDDALGASMLEEIRRTAERRLQQIQPLIEEAEQLRCVLDAIAKRPTHGASATRSGRTSKDAAPRDAVPQDTAPRAKKGANKSVILDLARRRPGITPAEIAKLTGMKRTVAASTVSRLKRYGYLQEHEQGGVRLGRDAEAELASPVPARAS
jgi:Fic family protein